MITSAIIGFEWEDRIIVSFAGGLLMYDALIHNLPKLLDKYDVRYKF